MNEVEAVKAAIKLASCPGREGPFGGYDYGHNEAFYGPAPEDGRYVIRDFRDPKSPDWGKWLHQTDNREEHEAMFVKMTDDHIAHAAIAALDAARGDAEPVAWMPIETAPKDGTAFQAIIPGHGADNVLCWTDGLIGSDGRDCGSWVFASDQEPPDCWTDGYCWEVNEDGVPSVQPTHWKPLLPPRGDQVARVAAWQPIETAPFDQMILLHCPHTVPKVSVGCCAEDCGWLIVEYDMMGSNCRPTHWTPLPKGPTDGPA